MKRWIALLALAATLSGCVGAMELGRAETLRQGRWEFGAAVGASVIEERKEIPAGEALGGAVVLIPLLPFDLSVSYGATDRLQLDGRVGTLSAQLGFKAALLRSRALSLAFSGRVSGDVYGRGLYDGASLRAGAALLAGTRLGRRFEVDLAPQCAWALDPARGRPELLGATASAWFLSNPDGGAWIGLAVSWLRYRAAHPGPGDVSEGDYVGGALVFARRGADDVE